MFQKSDVEGVEHSTGHHILKAESFSIGHILNKNTWSRALVNFRIVSLYESKGMAAYLMEVGQRGDVIGLCFIRSLPLEGTRGGEVGKVGSSGTEFIPKKGQCIA